MALTGAGLLAFLIAHLVGNLYVFQGQEALNAYAAWLKGHPLLWPARVGLMAMFGVHIAVGISLARDNSRARPIGYRRALVQPVSSWASRSMLWTGMGVLMFLGFHLAHFTGGWILPESHAGSDARGWHDVYGMLVAGLQTPWIAGLYFISMGVLAIHLSHAGQSLLQTLGIRYEHGNQLVKGLGYGLVAIVAVGNLLLPSLLFLGFGGGEAVESVPRAALTSAGGAP